MGPPRLNLPTSIQVSTKPVIKKAAGRGVKSDCNTVDWSSKPVRFDLLRVGGGRGEQAVRYRQSGSPSGLFQHPSCPLESDLAEAIQQQLVFFNH